MQIEILALRQQLAVLQRRTNKCASLRTADRLFWVLLSRLSAHWALSADRRQADNWNCVAAKVVSIILAFCRHASIGADVQERVRSQSPAPLSAATNSGCSKFMLFTKGDICK